MKERKRPYKPRDPEGTKKLLVDTVGIILKKQGHQGLGVNKIALLAGVSKKMIYWYFNSYNNLLKTYIKGRDFWRPVLNNFGSEQPPAKQELPGFISDIFQDQFNSFFNDPELQKMILWQVSESNPLLKEISDERESQADPIIKLTDSHFHGSRINFRAVLALMLGGIYYVVWHANTNKSKICGLNINDERDRAALQKAIHQVIEVVWQAAEAERKQ